MTRVLALLSFAVCLAGCPRGPGGGDVGPVDSGPQPDTPGHDAFVSHGTAPTLAPCTDTSVCADAPGVACLTDVAGGACTRRCTVDADCGSRGSCVQNVCLWACNPGTGDCIAHAGACVASTTSTTGTSTPSYCAPICYPTGREPPGYPTCGAGLVCDPYTSTCVSSLVTGADNGAPCRDAVECRGGGCFLETDFTSGASTGFLDGACVSYGIVPSTSEYVPGAPLPQGSCPDGSAMIPGLASSFFGDLAICFVTCTADTDCRAGYACTHLEGSGVPQFANGLCLPLDCTSAPCPAGTTCGTTPDPWLAHPVCGRAP